MPFAVYIAGEMRLNMSKLFIILIYCLFSATSVLAATGGKSTQPTSNVGNICRTAITVAEINNKIPGELLQAISLIESGKWNEKEKNLIAWPWTVTVEGKGHYLNNFNEAYATIRKYQKKGVTNIDVGCLQINLAAHGKNFIDVKEILDPVNNVAYGASFLTHLRGREHSWTRAVKFYHSAKRMYHMPYSKKVIKKWQNLRKEKAHNKKEKMQNKVDKKKTSAQISSVTHWEPKGYTQKKFRNLSRNKIKIAN